MALFLRGQLFMFPIPRKMPRMGPAKAVSPWAAADCVWTQVPARFSLLLKVLRWKNCRRVAFWRAAASLHWTLRRRQRPRLLVLLLRLLLLG